MLSLLATFFQVTSLFIFTPQLALAQDADAQEKQQNQEKPAPSLFDVDTQQLAEEGGSTQLVFNLVPLDSDLILEKTKEKRDHERVKEVTVNAYVFGSERPAPLIGDSKDDKHLSWSFQTSAGMIHDALPFVETAKTQKTYESLVESLKAAPLPKTLDRHEKLEVKLASQKAPLELSKAVRLSHKDGGFLRYLAFAKFAYPKNSPPTVQHIRIITIESHGDTHTVYRHPALSEAQTEDALELLLAYNKAVGIHYTWFSKQSRTPEPIHPTADPKTL